MKYKELLNQCKDNPGCFSTNRQNEIESEINYKSWINKMNIEYSEKINKKSK